MPATYIPLATTTLGSDSSAITFQNISQLYTDLVVKATIKPQNTGTAYLGIRVGSSNTLDTGTNYSNTQLIYTGSGVSSYSPNNETFIEIVGNQFQAKSLFTLDLEIMNYSSTSYNKAFFADPRTADNTNRFAGCLWRSNNAINTISIYNTSGSNSIAAGSTATIYGIKAA
jgi:hypothetical protein